MSFFSSLSLSLSPHHRHHRGGHYGSGYYQRKGVLGNLIDAFISRSSHGYYYNGYADPNININVIPGQNQPVQHQQHPYQANQNYQQSQSSSVCVNCNAAIPAGSKFCLNCGTKVNANPNMNAGAVAFCPNCGDGLLPNARFCKKCGVKLNP